MKWLLMKYNMMNEIQEKTGPLRIFLCHSSEDKPAVRNLYQRLSNDGFKPWLDEEDILGGQEWEDEIPKAVKTSDVAARRCGLATLPSFLICGTSGAFLDLQS